MKAKALRIYLPLFVLIVLAIVLAKGLQYDPRTLPSAKIGKPAPAFSIPVLSTDANSTAKFSAADMRGQVWILNVFASWCAACVDEAPSLLRFAESHQIPLIGLAYKDALVDTEQWLKRFGNPYKLIASDLDGNVGIDFGVYGVPETYVIDAEGVIRYRHVGAVDDDFFNKHVLPVIQSKSTSNAMAEVSKTTEKSDPVTNAKPLQISEAEVEARVKALATVLRCLVCQNQTIADSHAALAVDLKRQITDKVRAGQSDETIKAYMIERYGEFILYDPPFNYKNLLLWLLPLAVLVIGFYLAGRSQRQIDTEPANKKLTKKRAQELEAMYQKTLNHQDGVH